MDIPKILLKDIDEIDSKPWNEPNHKLSDYFNYSDTINLYLFYFKSKFNRKIKNFRFQRGNMERIHTISKIKI